MSRLRSILLAALALGAALSTPASAQAPAARTAVLGQPNYARPDLTNRLVKALGDSRRDSGGVTNSSTNYLVSASFGAADTAWLPIMSGGTLLLDTGFDFAQASATSAYVRDGLLRAMTRCDAPGEATTQTNCYDGHRTTATGTISTSTLTVASATGITIGDFVLTADTAAFTASTTVTNVVGTTITVDHALAKSITNNTTTFVPAASVGRFDLYGGLQASGAYAATDPNVNTHSTGVYSPCTHPGRIALLGVMNGNDTSLVGGILQEIDNDIVIIDTFKPTGTCHNLVLLGNELPRGRGTAVNELHTVASGTFTVTQGATYNAHVVAFYAPTASPWTNDGVALVDDGVCNSGCTPAAGHLTHSTAGVYNFNAADNGARIAVDYMWLTNPGGNFQWSLHNWLQSSASNFYDPITATTYNRAGALYGRKFVVPVDTFGQLYDTTSGASYYGLPYTFCNGGVHLCHYGAKLLAQAELAALAPYLPTTEAFPLPTVNGVHFSGTYSFTATNPAAGACNSGGAAIQNKDIITALNPATSTGLYKVGQVLYVPATPGIPNGTTITCVDTTASNYVVLSARGTTTNNFTSGAALAQDPADTANLLPGFDHNNITTTTVTNCGTTDQCTAIPGGTKGYPRGWVLTMGTQEKAQLDSGALAVAYGIMTNPYGDGFDTWRITVRGTVGSSATSINLAYTLPAQVAPALVSIGTKYRMVCKIRLNYGPNGNRMRGLSGARVKLFMTPASAVTPPGSLASFNNESGSIGDATSGYEFIDLDAGLSDPFVSLPVDTTSMATPLSSVVGSINFAATANAYVNFQADVSQCKAAAAPY